MKSVFLVLMLLLAVIGGHVLSQHCPRIPQPFFLMEQLYWQQYF
ncbi:hypothetical protein ACUIJQ_11990 [Levilactobacillus hammesii]|nr:hypothetical protein [Levilactobacillus hammesii]